MNERERKTEDLMDKTTDLALRTIEEIDIVSDNTAHKYNKTVRAGCQAVRARIALDQHSTS